MKQKDIFNFKISKLSFIFYFHILCNIKMDFGNFTRSQQHEISTDVTVPFLC